MAEAAAVELIRRLSAGSLTLAAAESCTAGLVADLLAQIPGASRVFWGSYVCYTAAAKEAMLGVAGDLIRRYGAVSRETALAMAEGALGRSGADLAVAVTGLAGPEGDGSTVPVGTVWIGVKLREGEGRMTRFHYAGSRNEVRLAAALDALRESVQCLKKNG
ncbi:MAG: nicotinamide-nucleotide amidohydrolase family protein [Spirochaetaceae bacterium]|jgi:PncC family amidohydrolase|nr:nicotinamide-nucleotide amidohydrolase family protein [Spirochaetaceae bacterium]